MYNVEHKFESLKWLLVTWLHFYYLTYSGTKICNKFSLGHHYHRVCRLYFSFSFLKTFVSIKICLSIFEGKLYWNIECWVCTLTIFFKHIARYDLYIKFIKEGNVLYSVHFEVKACNRIFLFLLRKKYTHIHNYSYF